SGLALFTVNYTSTGQTPAGSVNSNINWNVQGYAQSISIESYTVVNSGTYSGNGIEQNPYIFSGNSNNASYFLVIVTMQVCQ
ncbi:MAG: hypothetical protein K2X04_08885, partial [Burkholderiales bacterium]|nr:hypothetical protein [Burkholderiales bacterium]